MCRSLRANSGCGSASSRLHGATPLSIPEAERIHLTSHVALFGTLAQDSGGDGICNSPQQDSATWLGKEGQNSPSWHAV